MSVTSQQQPTASGVSKLEHLVVINQLRRNTQIMSAAVLYGLPGMPMKQLASATGGVNALQFANDMGSQNCVVQIVMNGGEGSMCIINPTWNPSSDTSNRIGSATTSTADDAFVTDDHTKPNVDIMDIPRDRDGDGDDDQANDDSSPSMCELPCTCPICQEFDACIEDDDNGVVAMDSTEPSAPAIINDVPEIKDPKKPKKPKKISSKSKTSHTTNTHVHRKQTRSGRGRLTLIKTMSKKYRMRREQISICQSKTIRAETFNHHRPMDMDMSPP